METVIFDHQTFGMQRYGGISRYFYELAMKIAENSEFNVRILAFAYLNEYLKHCPEGIVTGFPVPRIPKVQKGLQIMNRELSRIAMQINPPEILHETFYDQHRIVSDQTKLVTTIHDMMPEIFPDTFSSFFSTEVRQQCMRRADHIIAVSENTKKDLINLFNVDPNKVSVVYHGVSSHIEDKNISASSDISDPYLLYVGTRPACKNFNRLLTAYAHSARLKKDFKLVCFGGDPFHITELELAHQLGLTQTSIIHLSGDDNLLASLYKRASAFIYPSLYEGFGMPVLEAMSLGCPVICSNTSSLPEVAGDAAEYFNPQEIEDIIEAIERVVYSSNQKKSLIELGLKRAKEFSWETCAKKTSEIYRSLL